MALQTQLLELPFQAGLSEKTYPAHVDVGGQTSIINGVFNKAGAIHKRAGYAALSKTLTVGTPATMASCSYLTSLGTGLIAIDGDSSTLSHVNSYNSTAAKWNQIDNIGECNAWRDGVGEWTAGTSSFDIAYGSGYTIVVWTALPRNATTKHTVYANVIDWSTGSYIYANYEVASSPASIDYSYVRVLVQGTTAMVVYKDATTTTDIYAMPLNLSTLAWGSATKIVSDYDTTAASQGFWDIAPITGGSDWIILYAYKSGATTANILKRITTANSIVTTGSAFGPPGGYNCPAHGVAVCADTTRIWTAIVYDDGANEKVYVGTFATSGLASDIAETATGITFTGTATIKVAICLSSATVAVVCASPAASTTVGMKYDTMTRGGSPAVLTAGTVLHQVYGVALAGKPFRQCGRTYCTVGSLWTLTAYTGTPPVSTTSPQGAYILLDLNETIATSGYAYVARPVANLAPRVANTTNSTLQGMDTTCGSWAVSATQWLTVGSITRSTSNRFGLEALTYDFAGDRWSGAELGGVRYMSGGIPSQFDGQRLTEVGFLHPPPTLGLSEQAGGNLTANGTYTYLVLYTWVDNKGNIQRSASSIGTITLVNPANKTVRITVGNCTNTLKQDEASKYNPPIGIQVYRNATAGSTFYQLFNDASALVNDPNSTTQTYDDATSDASLAALGYGTWPFEGGALEGYCPPSLQKLVVYNLRLWGIGDDRQSLWYTSSLLESEQPRFTDSWRMHIGERIVGLEVMDNVLYVFTTSGIMRIAGNGPNEENAQNDLQGPDIVPTDAACIESRSILSTPLGIFFQAAAGIYLLARGGSEVVFIGQAVEDTVNANPVIKTAVLLPAQTEVRFECAPTEASTTGVTVVYNYTFKAWSVFQKYDGDATLASAAAVSATAVDDVYYWAVPGGRVYQESSTSYLDGSQWATLTVVSAWAKASAIQGWGRFRYVNVLAQSLEAHDLVVSIGYDYSSTYTQTHTFTADEMARWTTPLEMAEVQLGKQKAAAVRVKISDAPPTRRAYTTGQGPALVGLQLEVGAMPRPYRLPPAQGA